MPLTLPRQVSPEYGTLIESVPIEAVPAIVMAQEVRPGPVALPFALHLIATGDVSVPSAVPVNFRSPGQLALKAPFAAVDVCSVTSHLKSVQVLGVGTRVDDVQLPISELLPAAVGSVRELLRSKAAHPTAADAAIDTTISRIRFFIGFIRCGLVSMELGIGPAPFSDHLIGYRAHDAHTTAQAEPESYHPIHARLPGNLQLSSAISGNFAIGTAKFEINGWGVQSP